MNTKPVFDNIQITIKNEKWLNLALAALLAYYIIQVVMDFHWGNFLANLAVDYGSFWSAGYVANTKGYAQVYDLNQMEQVQKPLFPVNADKDLYATVPTPFLPVYIFPFQLFALMKPFTGFVVWSIINILGFMVYLLWLFKKLSHRIMPTHLLIMFLFSLPVFLNLFWGQVNLLLMICIGEYIRGIIEGKAFRAGLWLGGLLLKPQLLILLLPTLLFQRTFKVLRGFMTNAGITLLFSFALAGFCGIRDLVELWLGYVNGLPSNEPQTMMNWRMIGLAIHGLMPSIWEWVIVLTGIIITVVISFSLWTRSMPCTSPNFSIALIGLLAATDLVAWHSHFATSMILIPALMLALIQGIVPRKLFLFWMFFPPILRFASAVVVVLIQVSILPSILITPLNFAFGFSGFVLNILLIIWSRLSLHMDQVTSHVKPTPQVVRIYVEE